MTKLVDSLNLIMDARLESSDKPENEPFQPSRIYPLPYGYEASILPADHPWFDKAKEALSLFESDLKDRDIERNFEVLTHGYPTCILTNEELPFVIKVCLDHGNTNPNMDIKRVLIAARVKKFVMENELDSSIYVPYKFLMPRPVEEGCNPEVFDYQHYAVIAEKVKIASNDLQKIFGRYATLEKLVEKKTITLEEAEELKSHFPEVVWSQLGPDIQLQRKMHCAYTIAMLGLMDMHASNAPLLEEGRFGLIDLNESYPEADSVFSFLCSHAPDKTGGLRAKEMENAKAGLYKFLKEPITRIKYNQKDNQDNNENDLIYEKYLDMLKREQWGNQMSRTCLGILDTNFQSESLEEKHINITAADEQRLMSLRKENLQERTFFARFRA